ncbi:MAG: tRNA pseudouridine(55) synthase TruB [Bacteroidota bacterium]
MTQQELLDGRVLLIDKPLEWTSFQVIGKLRWIFKIKKIGHAGTLDPLATGLLIVCTGKFTKKINDYMGMEKEYRGTITLGASTPTYDLESEPFDFQAYNHLTEEAIFDATVPFKGPIQQIPPAHSAIQINGQRAYDLARQGKIVKLEPRAITIQSFEITAIELPLVHFKVVCSTGTYIRSLANDFGASLGVGGYLSSLRRTRIGMFSVDDAKTPAEIEMEMKTFREKEQVPFDN